MIYNNRQYEEGATAIIIVVFSVLLLVTITVGFMRLVVQDQIRSENNELSRGAYDSAMAGVEDGKRVLEACRQNPGGSACTAIDAKKCSTVSDAGLAAASNNEVLLRTNSGSDGGFDQAYTCVKIDPNTPDYQGSLNADESRIIPLQTTSAFDTIQVSWFKSAGLSNINLTQTGLPKLANWSTSGTTPPIIRAQLIMYRDDGYKLTDFDATATGGSTLYLYPASSGTPAGTSVPFSIVTRPDTSGASIVYFQCDKLRTYVCSAKLKLPQTVNPSATTGRYVAYLRLTALYNSADFSVEPSGTDFKQVQPAIDSTGRASDVFRRVSARVERTNPSDAQLFPRATVDITKNFCKSFGVTTTGYIAGSCNYNQP